MRRYSGILPVPDSKFYPPLGPQSWSLLWTGCLEKCSEAKVHATSSPALRDQHYYAATGKHLILSKMMFVVYEHCVMDNTNYFLFEILINKTLSCFSLLTYPLQHGLQLPLLHPLGDVLQSLCVIQDLAGWHLLENTAWQTSCNRLKGLQFRTRYLCTLRESRMRWV